MFLFADIVPTRLLRALILAFAFAIAGIALPAHAQLLPGTTAEDAAPAAAADPFGRDTPRDAVTGLLDALAKEEFTRAAYYFFLIEDETVDPAPTEPADAATATPAANTDRAAQVQRGAALARRLKLALDRGGTLLPYAALSNQPQGKADDGLAPAVDDVGNLAGGGGDTVPILIERTQAPAGAQLWLIAPDTIAAIEALAPAAQAGAASADDTTQIAGAPAMDWLKLIAIAIGSFLLLRIVSSLLLTALRRWLPDHEGSAIYRLLYAGLPPLALYLSVLTFYLTANALAVSIVARQTLLRYAGIVAWIALAWFALRLVDGIAKFFAARMIRAERRQAVSIITFLRRGAKVLVLAIAAVAVLDTIGFDVTTGIAALGIGGIALALGAQKTIENLVGSITIIADKPVQVGDVARIGDTTGTVEDIGMRSTRVRTNERTVVSIPNGDLAAQRIENYALRDRFLFQHTVGVSYDTDAAAMDTVLVALREMIAADGNIIEDDARVRFRAFGDSSLDIEVFCYFRTDSFPVSLEMQERLLLAIMRKLEELNVDIAFPTRTINLQPTALMTEGAKNAP